MPKGPYQDIRFTDFSGGLATKIEDNKIADNQSPDLQNIVFDGGGSFLPRTGSKIFGTTTSASGAITRTWTTQNSQGLDISMRMVDDTSTQYLEYYNPQTTAWENLDTGFTTGQDFGVAYYDFYIYWSSPKDYMRRWNGIVWSTSTYADSAYSRIDLSTSAASALGFLSAGSVVIDGEEVYYSSINGTALSGITFTTAHDGGVGIAQLPTSAGEVPAPDGGWASAASSIPHGSMMYEQDAQLFVAGLSSSLSAYNSNVLWYSAVDEPTNYTISAVPGGGGSARYPETTGGIKALNSFGEDITVLKNNTIRKLHFSELADGTAGSIEIVSRNEVTTGANVGAINNESVVNVENDFIYVTPSGWVKNISNSDKGLSLDELSKVIRPTVESLDMTNASGIYFAGKYHLACATNGSAFNNIVYVFDYDFKSWTRYVGWNVADWFINNGVLYYGASNEIATYQAYINYDDNDGAYISYWKSKWMDFGVPNEEKRLNQVYVEGYLTTNTTIGVSAYFDGDINAPRPKSIVGSASYVSNTDNITVIGSVVWGSGVYGGSTTAGSQFNLKKFRCNLKFAARDFYNMQIKIGTSSPGYVYKITHIVPYLAPIPGKRIPTNNII